MSQVRPSLNKLKRVVFLSIANVLSGTHFFGAERTLLGLAGIPVGEGTRVVGPVHMGTASSLRIGSGAWVGHDFSEEGNGTVTIGNNVDIAPYAVFSTGGHEITVEERRAGAGASFDQEVADGTWIGIRCTFVNSVTVGKSSVVAAGAVVAKDVEPNTLVGGVPARIIRKL